MNGLIPWFEALAATCMLCNWKKVLNKQFYFYSPKPSGFNILTAITLTVNNYVFIDGFANPKKDTEVRDDLHMFGV